MRCVRACTHLRFVVYVHNCLHAAGCQAVFTCCLRRLWCSSVVVCKGSCILSNSWDTFSSSSQEMLRPRREERMIMAYAFATHHQTGLQPQEPFLLWEAHLHLRQEGENAH